MIAPWLKQRFLLNCVCSPRLLFVHQVLHGNYMLEWCSEHLQWCSVCDPITLFLTSKLRFFLIFFGGFNPTHKTKTHVANRWQTTKSKPYGPIIIIHQSEIGSSSQIILLHSSLAGVRLCLLSTLAKCANMLAKNYFAEPNLHIWQEIFNLQGHILSTSRVVFPQTGYDFVKSHGSYLALHLTLDMLRA